MERNEVLDWLHDHPQEVANAPEDVIKRCEDAVHEHVSEETWLLACEVARERERYWRDDGGGAHASEAFVAREVCRKLATELRGMEPVPQSGQAGAYVDADALAPLGKAGRTLMLRYVFDLARREEHDTWLHVLDFTRAKGLALARQRRFSKQLDFDRTHGYAETAARVMHILAEDFEDLASRHAR
jgi:hypothetical protein